MSSVVPSANHTHQEWFDIACIRARDKRKAINHGSCSYLDVSRSSGEKIPGCFIGCGLTEDVLYFMRNEPHGPIRNKDGANRLHSTGVIRGFPGASAARALQRIHDQSDPETWAQQLVLYAEHYGLQVNEDPTQNLRTTEEAP